MSLKNNIYKLYVIKIAKWFMLIMPIITLFYQENGLGMKDVLLLQGIYSIAIVILEIPSGYFADIWGRKNTLIIGSILGVVGFGIYSVTFGFWGFLIAELTLGIGQSFISGSDSALLYDTLLLEKREQDYVKIEGQVLSIGNFAETFAAILGGFIAEFSLRTPFIAQTLVAFIAVPAAFMLIEPQQQIKKDGHKTNTLFVLKNTLLKNKELQALIIFTAFIGTATLTMAWFIQPYLKDIQKLSLSEIGIALSLLNLTVGLTTLIAYKIEESLGKIKSLIFIVLGITGSYFLIGTFQHWSIFFIIVLFYFVRGVATPILKDYINKATSSEIRATILSIRNFAIRIVFAIAGPFIGWYSDSYSLQQALIISGWIVLIGASVSLIVYIKVSQTKIATTKM